MPWPYLSASLPEPGDLLSAINDRARGLDSSVWTTRPRIAGYEEPRAPRPESSGLVTRARRSRQRELWVSGLFVCRRSGGRTMVFAPVVLASQTSRQSNLWLVQETVLHPDEPRGTVSLASIATSSASRRLLRSLMFRPQPYLHEEPASACDLRQPGSATS